MTTQICALAATLAVSLTGQLAYAQTAFEPPAGANPPASHSQLVATGPNGDTAPVVTDTGVTTSPTGAIVTHKLVSSQPVPDTPNNRAKYGRPLSNTGRHTQPAGN